jgi:hypothetical protein
MIIDESISIQTITKDSKYKDFQEMLRQRIAQKKATTNQISTNTVNVKQEKMDH